MKEIIYNNLPEEFSDELVRELRKMESAQSPNWIEIFHKMTSEQERMYLEIKSRQIKEENELEKVIKHNHFFPDDLDNQFREWWIRFVNIERHPTDLTLEDEINAIMDSTFFTNEKIEELFDYKARKRISFRRNYIEDNELFCYFWATRSSCWRSFATSAFLKTHIKLQFCN